VAAEDLQRRAIGVTAPPVSSATSSAGMTAAVQGRAGFLQLQAMSVDLRVFAIRTVEY
jgi:hypothetical protein